MQNGKYYWVKIERVVDWTIGQFVSMAGDTPQFIICGESSVYGLAHAVHIGPEVISPALQPERAAMPNICRLTCGFCGYEHYADPNGAEPCRKCRDRFAMAALSSLGAEMSPDETADAAYEYADAMLAARSKLKS